MAQRALIIGAGIAGIQASLDIANSGYEVILVEKEPSIGGHMAQLSETFPTLDCSQCILTPRTVEAGHHENIHLYTYSEVESIRREETSQDFVVRIRRRASYVNWDLCTGCGVCQEKCPFKTSTWFEGAVGQRKVIYTLSPQAVPNKPVIDEANCRYIQSKRDIEAGRIPAIDARGNPAKEIVFLQCCGSRDPQRGVPYCSKICCMYAAKQAILYKHRVPDGQAYIFYIDIRAGGKGYEEFLNRAQEEEGVVYLRGKVSKLFQDDGKVIVKGVDTLSGRTVEIEADLVVLATAVVPRPETFALAESIGLLVDPEGFLTANNEELDPLSTAIPGVYLAGTVLGPKDIPETVAQASGAAAKVLVQFQHQKMRAGV
jgi:heterodisulfide reductase subunit A